MAAVSGRLGDVRESVRSWLGTARRSWPVIRPILLQLGVSGVLAAAAAFALGRTAGSGVLFAVGFAVLFAVVTLELICARHHRTVVVMGFGTAVGLLVGAAFNPAWPTGEAFGGAVTGAAVAVAVAVASTPANPVDEVHRTVDPLLGVLGSQIRMISAALRTGDMAAAGRAVYALNACDPHLRRLDRLLVAVRRSAPLARWRSRQDVPRATTMATEIVYAVRHSRTMAVQAWRGVLREGHPAPVALPPMLDAMADGIAVLRGELDHGAPLDRSRALLVSSAQWAGILRTGPLDVTAAGVASSAEAAVVNLIIATGVPLDAAETAVRRPAPVR